MALRPRKGLLIEPKPVKPFNIRPVGGLWKVDPGSEIPLEASPDMFNCRVYKGILRKRPGYTQFPSAAASIGGPVVGIYSTQDNEGTTHLLALWEDGAVKYVGGTWTAMTGPVLNGSAFQPFAFETSQNNVVFSQGVDQVMVHALGSVNTIYALLNANCPAARYLIRWADRLNILYTVEGGLTQPRRLRRPVANDHTNWTGTGSGFNDLTESPSQIRGALRLGTQLAIYSEKAIHLATRQLTSLAPYAIDPKADNTGLLMDRTLKALPGTGHHIFVGTDDVYEFNGANAVALALPIRDELFTTLTPSALRESFAEILADTQEIPFFLSAESSSTINVAWVFNYGRRIWYPWRVSGPKCGCLHRVDGSTTIDSLVGTIDEQLWEFDNRGLLAAFPALLTGHADGKIYRWGDQYLSDDGAAISCRWTSRDFTSKDLDPAEPPSTITLKALGVLYEPLGADVALNVSYSTDAGMNWTGPFVLTLPSNRTFVSIDRQVTGPSIRWKIEQNSATQSFAIKEFQPTFEFRDPLQS